MANFNFQNVVGKLKQTNRNTIFIGVAVIFVVIAVVIIVMNTGGSSSTAVAKKSVDYINKNLLQGQGQATLGAVSEESGLIKFKITIGGQSYDSYATKDGKLFFPQAFDLNTAPAAAQPTTTTNTTNNTTK